MATLMSLTDSWQDWIAAGWANEQKVATVQIPQNECPSAVWALSLGDITIEQGLDQLVSENKSWLFLLFSEFRDFTDDDVHQKYCEMIQPFSMMAVNVYIQTQTLWSTSNWGCQQPTLTSDESLILLASFHSYYRPKRDVILPMAEKQVNEMTALGTLAPYPEIS